ncbi:MULTISPECIES: HRDC domain-containing protein [Acinetobacter]|jgi:ribonuclease D|uniref:HRDC domain-containing protein n=1 Tax=Acinetobacter towneri TaxID=202956 RepID=A0AAP4M425_9GAMM|nr:MULTISPECIES: HRDC domain-containing protein [Acinetobacter]MCA4790716.1 HRDC domain-containing protein [Acinetobacter towneri]MCA4798508.1 HRDC domain-containing protein [Acinetobacter towneri]MCA4815171.1 HRDC domain-containing protein [Acinetobacter towneri]MCO8053273.1 HRDC domain-containing protein [Acinetobacter towneri]MCO8056885.1 HRDC domain-containing protein [Acinetobacter towneri]
MFQFIHQQKDFENVLALMSQNSIYGLDTEFIKVDTLWPKLGVFQINVNDQVYLLDGTSLNLSAFWEKLFQAQQNIFHACGEDIDLIYHYAQQKNLDNVFDTQVGMSFLGHGLQVSYQNALKTMLNVDIDKGQTRSDWLARPLSDEQLNYAANDVLYLMQLADKVQTDLKQNYLLDFAQEDCRNLTQEIGEETPLELLYQDVGNYRHSRRQLMQLQQLAVWREQMVKALNQPRSFILRNSTMLDLVEKNPKNQFQLSTIKDLRAHIVREHGKTILDLIKYLPDQSQWPLRMARPIRHSSKEVGENVEQVIQRAVQETQIPKEVLLRKKWLNALYQHVVFHNDEQDLPNYLLGWRYELLTKPLIEVLHADERYLSGQMKVAE